MLFHPFRFALLIAFLFTVVTQARAAGSPPGLYEKRAPKKHNDPPCPPSSKKPNFPTLKDPGASVGVLPYTKEGIKKANEEHEASAAQDKRRSLYKDNKKPDNNETLSKRVNGQNKALYDIAVEKVGTDESRGLYFNWKLPIEQQIVATRDLSGCTVLVVASPLAVFVIHVWERRDNSHDGYGWLFNPSSDAQTQMDAEFLAQGQELLNGILKEIGGSAENGFNGWFPTDMTTVHVVAPAANPDYDPPANQGFVNPWYADNARNPLRLIYREQAEGFLIYACEKIIPDRMATQGRVHSYRRRYSDDPAHGTDDRDYIILKPQILSNYEVWLYMFYDDDRGFPLVRMA